MPRQNGKRRCSSVDAAQSYRCPCTVEACCTCSTCRQTGLIYPQVHCCRKHLIETGIMPVYEPKEGTAEVGQAVEARIMSNQAQNSSRIHQLGWQRLVTTLNMQISNYAEANLCRALLRRCDTWDLHMKSHLLTVLGLSAQ